MRIECDDFYTVHVTANVHSTVYSKYNYDLWYMCSCYQPAHTNSRNVQYTQVYRTNVKVM